MAIEKTIILRSWTSDIMSTMNPHRIRKVENRKVGTHMAASYAHLKHSSSFSFLGFIIAFLSDKNLGNSMYIYFISNRLLYFKTQSFTLVRSSVEIKSHR